MNIVIVGEGKVGFTLTSQLSKQGHNVTVIDNRSTALRQSGNILDVFTVEGNGASYAVQMEAGVKNADLFIAMTGSDEVNILCCMVARQIGARHTIARVRHPDYNSQIAFYRDQLGLSLTVNPEMHAAREISRMLRFPSASNIHTFAGNRVEILETRIEQKSPLNGLALKEIYRRYQIKALVCAVERGEEVFIPTGDFILRAGDRAYITAPTTHIADFFRAIGLFKERVRNVMIIGGSRIAAYLSRMLPEMGMRVTLIEIDPKRAEALNEMLPKTTVLCGDGSDQELLLEEGLERADALVALTGIDEENILLGMFARAKGVPKVIVKVGRTSFLDVLDEQAGLDGVISPKQLTADRICTYVRAIENAMGSGVETMRSIVEGKAEALEFRVRQGAKHLNTPLRQINLKPGVLLCCVIRDNVPIICNGDTTILSNDRVIVMTTLKGLNEFSDIFA